MKKNYVSKKILLALVFFSFASIVLNSIRIEMVGYDWYSFLTWNLFLAWVPFGFSCVLWKLPENKKYVWIFQGIILMLWLLFFPNAPYIITDLMYLNGAYGDPNTAALIWYDSILFLSYVMNGLLVGLVSLSQVHDWLDERLSKTISRILIGAVMILSSFGIYLGRFERWNSWDIFYHPILLIKNSVQQLLHPIENPKTYVITILFSLFLGGGYGLFRLFLKNQAIKYDR
jgi:uncharacterized membrane protein